MGKYIIRIIYSGFVSLLFIYILIKYFGQAIIVFFPYGVMISYFVFRTIFRKDDFWPIKFICYLGVRDIDFRR